MAHFVISCIDRPQSLALRLANRPAHLAFVAADGEVRVILAGPYLDEAGEMSGSLFLVEAPDAAAAAAFNAADPYTLAGLFERVEIRPWRRAVGLAI